MKSLFLCLLLEFFWILQAVWMHIQEKKIFPFLGSNFDVIVPDIKSL